MNGYTALWYARSRYSATDYDRMQRQRVLQEAILRQFTPANVLTKFQAVAAAGAETVRTDIPQSMLGYFVDLAGKTRALPIQSVELTPEAGIEPAYPDWDLVHGLIQDAIATATASPTPPATETG